MKNTLDFPKYNIGDKVLTYFDREGLDSSPVKTKIHTRQLIGFIKKCNFRPERNTYSYGVSHENGYFITEQNDIQVVN